MNAAVDRISMLITSDGQWVLEDSPEFLEALGDPNPDYDAATFAVKNLGFIKFQIFSAAIVEIELHPRNIGLPALLAVQQQLLSTTARLFRIRYFDTAWRSEISASVEHTIGRLSELCAPALQPPPTERFVSEEKDLSKLFGDETNPARPLAQKWRAAFGNFDSTVIGIALKSGLLSRLMIIGVKSPDWEPVWRFIGDGHRWIGNQYQCQGVGERIENQPDREYGGWLTEFYKTVARSGQPRYDLVSAQMQYQNETGKPRRAARYERLMLPWRTPSGEVFVTMCSRVLWMREAPTLVSSSLSRSDRKKLARSS